MPTPRTTKNAKTRAGKASVRARKTTPARAKTSSVILQARVDSNFAEELLAHDAVVLEDTVRANFFAGDAPDAALWRALEAVEMDGRIREAGGLDAWVRQDRFSLGEVQRINLARAWLSSQPLVLLDEPTEHLDDAQGERILGRLLARFSDRIVVVSSHRATPLRDTHVIELQP